MKINSLAISRKMSGQPNPQHSLDYSLRYKIMASRVNYANYVQKRQLIMQSEANLQNPYPPTNDAAIVPLLKRKSA